MFWPGHKLSYRERLAVECTSLIMPFSPGPASLPKTRTSRDFQHSLSNWTSAPCKMQWWTVETNQFNGFLMPSTVHAFDFLTPSDISTRAIEEGVEAFKRAMATTATRRTAEAERAAPHG